MKERTIQTGVPKKQSGSLDQFIYGESKELTHDAFMECIQADPLALADRLMQFAPVVQVALRDPEKAEVLYKRFGSLVHQWANAHIEQNPDADQDLYIAILNKADTYPVRDVAIIAFTAYAPQRHWRYFVSMQHEFATTGELTSPVANSAINSLNALITALTIQWDNAIIKHRIIPEDDFLTIENPQDYASWLLDLPKLPYETKHRLAQLIAIHYPQLEQLAPDIITYALEPTLYANEESTAQSIHDAADIILASPESKSVIAYVIDSMPFEESTFWLALSRLNFKDKTHLAQGIIDKFVSSQRITQEGGLHMQSAYVHLLNAVLYPNIFLPENMTAFTKQIESNVRAESYPLIVDILIDELNEVIGALNNHELPFDITADQVLVNFQLIHSIWFDAEHSGDVATFERFGRLSELYFRTAALPEYFEGKRILLATIHAKFIRHSQSYKL